MCCPCKAPPAEKACRALVSIDASKGRIEAVRTCQGEPEERQVLECGPGGMGVCTWKDGGVYESDVPNLTIKSREAAKVVPTRKNKCTKPKGKASKKAKAKAAAKADDDSDDSSDEAEEASGEHAEKAVGEQAGARKGASKEVAEGLRGAEAAAAARPKQA